MICYIDLLNNVYKPSIVLQVNDLPATCVNNFGVNNLLFLNLSNGMLLEFWLIGNLDILIIELIGF